MILNVSVNGQSTCLHVADEYSLNQSERIVRIVQALYWVLLEGLLWVSAMTALARPRGQRGTSEHFEQ